MQRIANAIIHTTIIKTRSIGTRPRQAGTCCFLFQSAIIILELVLVLEGVICMDWKAVGKRIRTAREYAGLTQEELAARLEMSPTHISVLERGVKPPKLENFVRIANVLGVSADYLLQDVVTHSQIGATTELAEAIMRLPAQSRDMLVSAIRSTMT